jgi:uncharacterized peroxidase-related enzyme
MSRFEAVDPSHATGKAKELLDGIQAKLGMVPNILRVLAASPSALEAYAGLSGALSHGTLSASLRERIALTVAEANRCEYCLAAHSATGRALGLSEEQVIDSRSGTAPDSKIDAALQFARELVEARGWVDESSISRLHGAGFGDGEIAEIVANTALHIFMNYFDHVAKPALDFPKALVLAAR